MSRVLQRTLQQVLLLFLSAALTVFTVAFGAIPMRVLWISQGRLIYWLGNLAIALGFLFIGTEQFVNTAFLYLVVAVMIGVFCEFELLGSKLFVAGFTSVITGLAAGIAAVGYWQHFTQKRWVDQVANEVQALQTKMSSMNSEVMISADKILAQLPSAVVMIMVLCLAASLAWDRGLFQLLRLKGYRKDELSLLFFRVPDPLIWLGIFSMVGAFLKHGIPMVERLSMNVFMVVATVFFIQGVSIVSMAMHHFKVAPFWRMLWVLVLVVPFSYVAIAIMGFFDFWIDFRSRLINTSAKKQA